MKHAALTFGKVILIVEGFSYIQTLLARLKGTESILEFDLVILKEMSHVARGDLIDKWMSLEVSKDNKDFSRRVEETERLIASVIGKNTLPSIPLIVLSLLQASDRNQDVLPENGAFGYLYEVLITTALNSTQGEKPQLDKKYTFLSLLAFRLFESSSEVLGEAAVAGLLEGYAKSYRIRIDKGALLRDLEHARVLHKEDGNYSFAYDHYFYYFLARYFKINLNGANGASLRQRLNEIARGLNAGSNGIFLMFVIYLTHDDALTDELVRMGDEVLSELQPSELTDEVEFYNSKDYAGIDRRAPECIDLDASRQRRREAADRARQTQVEDVKRPQLSPIIDGIGYSSDLPLRTKLQYATSCLEILGQILRNFTGSLPGDRKLMILKTTYLLGLRALRAVLSVLGDATLRVKEEIALRDMKKASERQFAKSMERFLTIIGQIIGVSMFQQISMNVGSPDIEETAYADTISEIGRNNATELIDLTIKLDHSAEYPFEQIKALKKLYSDNRFALMVLKDLVIANMHVFEISREMRQRVQALLDAGPLSEGVLSRGTKRLG